MSATVIVGIAVILVAVVRGAMVTGIFNKLVTYRNEELRSTENKVAFARQAFNDGVTLYNTYRQTFPTVVFAGEAIQEVPKVSF